MRRAWGWSAGGLRGRRTGWLEAGSPVSKSWLSEPDRKRSFSESSKINAYIEKLIHRAHHGLHGEKPLAILAAIEFINSGFEEGRPKHSASLSELLANNITSNAIKSKFMILANKTGKLKAPDWSWGNIVSHKHELIDDLKINKSVDRAFRSITKEQTLNILKNYYHKLGLELNLQ
jgi:hypothetical protein